MTRCLVVLLFVVGLYIPAQSAGLTSPKEKKELQPFELVRSLQLLQDQVAVQGSEPLSAYRSAIEAIGKALPAIHSATWHDARNVNAAAQYLLLGGNPKVVESLIATGALAAESSELLDGTLSYLAKKGDRFASLGPQDFNPLLGANIAYVRGLLMAKESPKSAAREFAIARLQAPGTLIEEAALRAEIDVSIKMGERDRFVILSRQYFQRFPNSALLPRVANRASAYLIGDAHMSDGDRSRLVQAWFSRMHGERAEVLRLEIASQAAVAGDFRLTSELAHQSKACLGCAPQYLVRAALYSLVSSLTAAKGPEIISELEAVDPAVLAPRDLELRNSAIAVAKMIWRPVEPFESDFEFRAMPDTLPAPIAGDDRDGKVDDVLLLARRELAFVDSLLEGKSR